MIKDKRAETRFKNDQTRAAQQAMGSNLAARNSLRPTGARNNRRRGIPQTAMNSVMQSAPGAPGLQTPSQQNNMVQPPPLGAPGALPDLGLMGMTDNPDFDQKTEDLVKQVRMDKLMSSSEMHDANMLVSLRDYWHNRDSGADRGRQVMEIMQTYAPPVE